MIKKAVGLYIGQRTIDMVVLGLAFGKVRLLAADRQEISAHPMSEDSEKGPAKAQGRTEGQIRELSAGQVSEPSLSLKSRGSLIVEAVKKLLRKNAIKSRTVVTALPSEVVVVRYFQMPRLSKEEGKSAVPFEAKKYLPFKIENIISDFCLITGEKVVPLEKMGVVFVAAEKNQVSSYVELFKKAGLKISHLEAVPFSLTRAFYFSKDVVKDETAAIVMLNSQEVSINLVRNRVPYLTRNVPLMRGVAGFGGEDSKATQGSPEFESLLSEVRLSFDYFHRQFPEEKIAKIILCGEDEFFKGWDKLLNSELKVEVEARNPLRAIDGAKECPPSFAIAAGLALRGLHTSPIEINLLPPELVVVAKKEIFAKVAIAEGIVLCLVLAGIQFAISKNISGLRGQLNQLISEKPATSLAMVSVPQLESLERKFRGKFSFLKGLIGGRLDLTTMLNHLGEFLPDDIWLTNFSFQDTILTIEGYVYSEVEADHIKLANDFVATLRGNREFCSRFGEIKLESVKTGRYKGYPVAGFKITCGIKKESL